MYLQVPLLHARVFQTHGHVPFLTVCLMAQQRPSYKPRSPVLVFSHIGSEPVLSVYQTPFDVSTLERLQITLHIFKDPVRTAQ
jgi:hypothetical protein